MAWTKAQTKALQMADQKVLHWERPTEKLMAWHWDCQKAVPMAARWASMWEPTMEKLMACCLAEP